MTRFIELHILNCADNSTRPVIINLDYVKAVRLDTNTIEFIDGSSYRFADESIDNFLDYIWR